MGASASKQVTRKLPKTARPETLRSIPRESPSTLHHSQHNEQAHGKRKDPLAVHWNFNRHSDDRLILFIIVLDIKNMNPDDVFNGMEQERSDPQLLENLAKLGPVTVPPTITRMRQVGNIWKRPLT